MDVSYFQGAVRWEDVSQDGVVFAYAKATGGLGFVDPRFTQNWHGMRSEEILRGAYHFFYAAEDGKAQAEHFLKTVGPLRPHDLPPMLDVEVADHTEKDTLVAGVLAWLEHVETETGRLPMIYTDPGFGDSYLDDPRLKKYPLWIAEYGPKVTSVPAPWKESGWSIWQHSQAGEVHGISGKVDLDIFTGDLDRLKAFAAAAVGGK